MYRPAHFKLDTKPDEVESTNHQSVLQKVTAGNFSSPLYHCHSYETLNKISDVMARIGVQHS